LEAAGASDAQLLVIAIDDADKIIEMATLAKKHFPKLKVVARAIDRRHAYQLLNLGVESFKRETFDSALNLGVEALKLLGNSEEDSDRAGVLFAKHDDETMEVLANVWGDDRSYGVAVKQRLEDLKQVLNQDKTDKDQLNTCQGSEQECKDTQ
jgi:glutathione-regulated potassium-efflux system ancillary protein KefC